VHGPLFQTQLVETLILNRLNYQTLIATKAARVCFAAEGDPVFDFGLRRAQGPDGGLSGSRASFIGGCEGTSNVLAGKLFDIPVRGTHAHSWVMSYSSEIESFRAYAKAFPANPLLLVDTYDTVASGVPNAIKVFKELRERGWQGRAAIRLDSGDLARLSKDAYDMLTAAGFEDPLIVGSSDLDEDLIADLKRQGAKINAWGVGTKLITGTGDPALTGVYKISAIMEHAEMTARIKVSSNPEKTTDPGVKNLIRFYDSQGMMVGDVLSDEREGVPSGQVTAHDRNQFERMRTFTDSSERKELHQLVMTHGKRIGPSLDLKDIQSYAKEELSHLRMESQRLRNPDIYYVGLSTVVADAKREAIRRYSSAVK
jgi:nicotinate phosphoribosyltransferase